MANTKHIITEHHTNTIKALKNLSLSVENVKTEDVPGLMRLLSWGMPDERKILNNLCKQLRKRKQLNYLFPNI